MKHFIYILIGGLLCLTACKKSNIEQTPLEKWTEDIIFDPTDSLGNYAKNFLNDIYTLLPTGYNRIGTTLGSVTTSDVLDAATDDAISSKASSTIESFTNGRISPFSLVDDAWDKNYKGIRKVNMFLANIGKVPFLNSMIVEKNYWIAESRFLRAMFYFEMVKRYGGVPLLGDKVLGLEDDLSLKRNTTEECTQYILSEIEAIKDQLRPNPVQDADLGRISKAAALALKSRLLLYLASPKYNPGNDQTKWLAAATAAKDLMNLSSAIGLESSFINVFLTRKNKEVILGYQRTVNTTLEKDNAPVGYTDAVASNGLTSPTQELVDAFEMKNGKAITDPTSGYNPANPYAGRDPRFDKTIFYNGSDWIKRKVETFEGGLDKPGGIVTQTRTGYYMRKFLADFSTATTYSNQTHNPIIFRYAEILLNFAEAQNEYAGPTAEVKKAVEDIRQRAGLVPFALASGLSKEQMREVIRHERRVEMAFEEQRFWDIRRWKIAEQVMNGKLHGMKIVKIPAGGFSYAPFEAASVTFDAAKMYNYPIPYSEITKNTNLTQNQGW
ncbi:RagB/SusD family nutrient uptake outer membrane protein [Pedobacter sp. KBW06]|uniref:RagB/SusD family nutrient uptake outer membrane protein n=1 Tax=Pedobacter sp. KBW06 TaxID=2153359 RepID=UPI000F5AE38D|nr:RagB/SusD family nutrient uptake outer membrane protein [Pedobacter sp. KBW06]RQO71873.1 RagB/SusD family nutrient uptake outer membrane protein [Pedobacter sp. KBW06]